MSRKDIGSRERDSTRDGRHDVGRNVRYPLHPPPLLRERMRGDSPRNSHLRTVSPPRSHRDRLRGDIRGRNGHRDPSPRPRHSRSPGRGSRHVSDVHSFRGRSPDGYRRRSLEPHHHRDSSRDRRVRSPPGLVGRASPPRFAMRTPPPPPPPPRSPHASMRRASPRYSMRPGSPQARMLLASPRSSLHPVSPRLALRPLSPQAPVHLHSPQVPMRPPRIPSPPLTSAFDREHNRHAHEAILGSRNGTILTLQSATPLGTGSADVLNKKEEETLSSTNLLVSRNILMNDGTVETFYALPPDAILNPLQTTVDSAIGAIGGQVLPSFSDGLSQYNTEPASLRYGGLDKYVPIERDFLASQDHRLPDRMLPVTSQYVAGDKSLPDYPSYQRDRPLSPHQSTYDRPLQRRTSRSPLHGGDGAISLPNRAGYVSEMEGASRRLNYDKREPVYATEAPFREGFSSPRRRRLDQDRSKIIDKDVIGYGRGERNGEIWRMSQEVRMPSPRYASAAYDLPRQRGPARSPEPRGSSRFEPRNASFQRQMRTPPRESSSRHDDILRRYPDHRSALPRHPSPDRDGRLSPRRMRSLTPPSMKKHASYMEERRAWKRKFIEMGGEPSLDHRNSRFLEPEFKRRERDLVNDLLRGRRQSGWDRKDGWLDRRVDMVGRSGHRPMRERSGSPRLSRRHPDIGRRELGRPNMDKNSASQREKDEKESRHKDEQELPPDLPEDSNEFKQQVQRSLLKYAKMINEDPEQRKKYEEQGKAGTLLCVACGRLSKTHVDTHSLVMHTLQSQKPGLRADHLGLCKAVCSIMGWSHDIDPAAGKAYQSCPADEAKTNKEDLILWPPAVIVHCAGKANEGQQKAAVESAVRDLLKDAGLSLERMKIAHGKEGIVIVKYSPLLPCLHDAERLHQHFASRNLGRDDWSRVKPAKQDDPNGEHSDDVEKSMLYGYLALAQDLDKVDPDLQRRCQVRSRRDIEVIIGDPLAGNSAED